MSKMLKPLQNSFNNLEDLEILEATSQKINDYVIPIELCCKLKEVSKQSINNAVRNGDLVKVEGITLESLKGYKVDIKKRTAGKIRVLNKLMKDKKEGK